MSEASAERAPAYQSQPIQRDARRCEHRAERARRAEIEKQPSANSNFGADIQEHHAADSPNQRTRQHRDESAVVARRRSDANFVCRSHAKTKSDRCTCDRAAAEY